jgi:hypothetical protein
VLPYPYIEKIIVAVVLFSGFTWLRRRSHRADPNAQPTPVLVGIFVVLPVFLLAEAKLVPFIPLTQWPLLAIKVGFLGLAFYGVGRFFIKPK